MGKRSTWKIKLNSVNVLARGSKLGRFLHQPLKYGKGFFFRKFVYPKKKIGKFATTTTFFQTEIQVLLPAGMDIYLLGAKTHISEIKLTRFLLESLVEGDTFVDIGAHFGYYSLLASKLTGTHGKVLSVEASPTLYKSVLLPNVRSCSNLICLNAVITEAETSVSFYEFPVLYSEYNTMHPEQYANALWYKKNAPKKVALSGKSLSSLVQEYQLEPTIIKIDVEGAELEVIKGMKSILTRNYPIVVMEYLSDERGCGAHAEAAHLLREIGYESYMIAENGSLQLTQNIQEQLVSQNLDSENVVFKATR